MLSSVRNRLLIITAVTIGLSYAVAAQTQPPNVVHVIVALADNTYQGIVPVPKAIGNGDDFDRNLYWGAGYGIRTFFKKSKEWNSAGSCAKATYPVLERCVFRNKKTDTVLVADAYRGREIQRAIEDFFAYSAGRRVQKITIPDSPSVSAGGASDLVAYVGHDGLMDFHLTSYETPTDKKHREVIILACASKQFFGNALTYTSAQPLLWTTGLMAPEAYILEAALAGWVCKESGEQIRERAAKAYNRYQKCGEKAAYRLFATGW